VRLVGMLITFHLVLLGWIFFRAQPVGDQGAVQVAWEFLVRLAGLRPAAMEAPPAAFRLLALVALVDLAMERSGDAFWARAWSWPWRGAVTAILILLGFILGSGESRAFIYFQF
jgi:hypothetical protein